MEFKFSMPLVQEPVICPYVSQIDLIHTLPVDLRSILILFSNIHSVLPGGLPAGFLTITLYAHLFSPDIPRDPPPTSFHFI